MTSNQRLPIEEIWVYLSGNPLYALILTLLAYCVGQWVYNKTERNPLANPVAIATVLIAVILQWTKTPYQTYFEGAQFVHFLLGTATVSLAVPIYKCWVELKQHWLALLVSTLAGGLTSVLSAVGLAIAFGVPSELIAPLFAKSVTAPIAMGVAQQISASPTLTAVYAVVTGILGASMSRFILDWVGRLQWWQRGYALGTGAHGIGTARAFSVNQEAGTFASLAMGMHGVLGALLIPAVLKLWP